MSEPSLETFLFTATEAGADGDEFSLVASAGCDEPYEYVAFQRDAEENFEDWGIHFEFNDQINSAYDCIQACSVSRSRLTVILTKPIDFQKRISSIDVQLEITDAEYHSFVSMLQRIFREQESLLQIN